MKIKINKKIIALLSAGFVLTGCSAKTNTEDLKEKNENVITINNTNNEIKVITQSSISSVPKVEEINKNFYLKEDASLKDINGHMLRNAEQYSFGRALEKKDNMYKVKIGKITGYINESKIGILDGTYVVADISSQNLKIYEDTKKVMETQIVSGKLSSPSTLGCFSIYSKTRNRYLKGPGYQSYVDIMMKYHNGEGLHDAEYHTDYDKNGRVVKRHGWRSKNGFGGEIYKYHGSHGCLNMPHDAAIKAGELLEVGDKVLVKK